MIEQSNSTSFSSESASFSLSEVSEAPPKSPLVSPKRAKKPTKVAGARGTPGHSKSVLPARAAPRKSLLEDLSKFQMETMGQTITTMDGEMGAEEMQRRNEERLKRIRDKRVQEEMEVNSGNAVVKKVTKGVLLLLFLLLALSRITVIVIVVVGVGFHGTHPFTTLVSLLLVLVHPLAP